MLPVLSRPLSGSTPSAVTGTLGRRNTLHYFRARLRLRRAACILLSDPYPVEQNCEFSGYRHDRPSTCVAAASRSQVEPPLPQGRVFPPRSDNVVGAFD